MRRSAPDATPLHRRDVLAAAAVGGTALTGGCLRRLRSITGWRDRSQISLDIRTVPPDADPYALRIARTIADWFRTVGIDAAVTPMSEQELLRSVLLEHDFDAFVGRLTQGVRRPDSLYPLLHSRFAEAQGWQNPFGYANLDVDADLEAQRARRGQERRAAIADVQRSIARSQPFTTLAFPDQIRAARTDRYVNWDGAALRSFRGYLQLQPAGTGGGTEGNATGTSGGAATTTTGGEGNDTASTTGDDDGTTTQQPTTRETTTRGTTTDATSTRSRRGSSNRSSGEPLRLVTTDGRITTNLNPLAAAFRRSGVVMDLLYDSLGYRTHGGAVRPWLASTWTVSATDDDPRITLELREDCTWHDGVPVTASDVAFTYSLLKDTAGTTSTETDDEDATPVPAPRYRGQSSLVEDVVVLDGRRLEILLADCSPRVGVRALTVPILPEHRWASRREQASVTGIDFGPTTEALVTDNVPPVGSGPLRYADHERGRSLSLERDDTHFLVRGDPANVPRAVRGGPAFERLELQVVGSDSTAVDMVVDGEADATHTPVGAGVVPRIARPSDVSLLVARSPAPYVLGYDVQSQPLSNARFRHTLGRTIDRANLAETVFEGYATPAASPLAGTQWLPDDLEWTGDHPMTPFVGSDGDLDADRARTAFEDAGFVYDDGALLQSD